MNPDDENLIAERSAELVETAIDDDLVAIDIARGACFGFNATAARVWALLDQPRPVAALVDRLVAEYAVDRQVCAAAVVALLHDLERRSLVTLRPA